MELNIGDYVRTTDGEIGKIIECPEELKENYGNWLWFETIDEQRSITKENITKSSRNIIDLIEVGDLVKLYSTNQIQQILYIDEKEIDLTDYIYYSSNKFKQFIKDDIEWVITHEQIEQMKYKVGE